MDRPRSGFAAGWRRQQLVWLSTPAWQDVLAGAQLRSVLDDDLDCLAYWAAHELPLVVTRQEPDLPGWIALGLPAPAHWQRRRLALLVPVDAIERVGEFPAASAITPLLSAGVRSDWAALCQALAGPGRCARVGGSHGWQVLTGLPCLHPGSDIDLLLSVADAGCADAVARTLDQAPHGLPRLDGELIFDDGAAVAWREWLAWRQGRIGSLLVKRLDSVALEDGLALGGLPA